MQFRYARHTQKLESLIYFYTAIFNFEILGKFENHDGYNGVFLGRKGERWHLEFTENDELPKHTFDEDDALVFYPESQKEYDDILNNLEKYEVPILSPKNSYWQENGICFEDCEHYPIIVSPQKIE